MESAKRLATNRSGISLIEILLAMGIMAILLSVSLPVGLNFYRSYQFDSETTLLVSLLESARNSTMVNFNESSHGVFISADNFIVFQGSSYAGRAAAKDKSFQRNSSISISGPSEIVFSSLSGQTSSSAFTVSNLERSLNINVNSEGTILY